MNILIHKILGLVLAGKNDLFNSVIPRCKHPDL